MSAGPGLTGTGGGIAAMFGRIAGWYDPLNRLLSFGLDQRWRQCLAWTAQPGSRHLLLDLAAGTLDVSLALARVHPGTRIAAMDFCLPMLVRGQRKLRSLISQIQLNHCVLNRIFRNIGYDHHQQSGCAFIRSVLHVDAGILFDLVNPDCITQCLNRILGFVGLILDLNRLLCFLNLLRLFRLQQHQERQQYCRSNRSDQEGFNEFVF